MLGTRAIGGVLLAWVCFASVPAHASATEPAPQSVTAERIHTPITFDGKLDEPAWRTAQPLDRFFETWPGALSAAPERTDVRLLYDDEALYVGLRMALKDPSRLRAPFVRRDQVNSTQDYVQIYLDPQGSRLGSYLFRINARGIRTDGYQDEPQETETLDPDWDWDVRTHVDDQGWTAELRIPLSTLRISRRGPQRWTVLVWRGVPRDQNTQMASAPMPRDSNCFLCHAGTLAFADLTPRTSRLLLLPSATLSRQDQSGSLGDARGYDFHPSLDAKWLPTDGDALDVTVHPDFSQVEADAPQLTGNQRFALDLPEKRPFFREGMDLVNTVIPAVYTRAIAAPDWGLRETHRSTGIEATGLLARDLGRPAIVEPGFLGSESVAPDFDADVGFLRGRATFAQGDAGGLLSLKRNDDGSHNLVGGVDAAWSRSSDRLLGQLLASVTRQPNRPDLLPAWTGQTLHGTALWLEWNHSTENVWTVRYQRNDPGFRSWLGYVPRVGDQALHVDFNHPFYGSWHGLTMVAPYASFDRVQGIGGQRGFESDPALGVTLSGFLSSNLNLAWHGDTFLLDAAGHERRSRFVTWTFSASPTPRVPYVSLTGQLGHLVDYATGSVVPGATVGLRVITRPLDRLELEAEVDRGALNGVGGPPHRLIETAWQVNATWHFNARLYARATWQDHRSARALPAQGRDHQSLAALQLNWDASRDVQLYGGVSSGSERSAGNEVTQGAGTEVYLKLAYALRL